MIFCLHRYRYINIIWFCCDWLAMSNSVCNPFVYGIYNVSAIGINVENKIIHFNFKSKEELFYDK